MNLCVHIPFLKFKSVIFESLIENFNNYPIKTDIFIHTHDDIFLRIGTNMYTNTGKIYYIITKNTNVYDSCRKMIKKKLNRYDYFLFCENDILFTYNNFKYWYSYTKLVPSDYNIGFVRKHV